MQMTLIRLLQHDSNFRLARFDIWLPGIALPQQTLRKQRQAVLFGAASYQTDTLSKPAAPWEWASSYGDGSERNTRMVMLGDDLNKNRNSMDTCSCHTLGQKGPEKFVQDQKVGVFDFEQFDY